MLDNVSANTIAGRELEAMSSTNKATLVAKLEKTLNANVNKVMFLCVFRLCFVNVFSFHFNSALHVIIVIGFYSAPTYSMSNKPSSMRNTQRLLRLHWKSIPMPFKTSDVKLHPRTKQQAPKNFEKLVEKHTPLGWLRWGLTTRKHERKGWLPNR
jgi:hypothetical protein